MQNATLKPQQRISTVEPKKAFESALSLIQSTPIGHSTLEARQWVPMPPSYDQPVRKRALTDAARALAQLWDLSPHHVR